VREKYSAEASSTKAHNLSIDLSKLWDGKHADGSPCNPLRLVLFLEYWTPASEGEHHVRANCPVALKVSGDGGASWTTLATWSVTADDDHHGKRVEVTGANLTAALWNASTVLRVEYTGDEFGYTSGWEAPTANYNTYWSESIKFYWLALCAEFDWDYKP